MNRTLLVVFFFSVLCLFSSTPIHSQVQVESDGSADGTGFGDGVVHPTEIITAKARTCPRCPTVPKLLTPVQGKGSCEGAGIRQNNSNIGCSAHPTRGYGLTITFDWTDATSPNGIVGYFIFVKNVNAVFPIVDAFVPTSKHIFISCNSFVAVPNLTGWQWRVRAQDRLGNLGPW